MYFLILSILFFHTIPIFAQDFPPKNYYQYNNLLLKNPQYIEAIKGADSDSDSDSIYRDDNIYRIQKSFEQVMSVLPNTALRRGLESYLSIINAKSYSRGDGSVGASNSGIVAHHENNIRDNMCFAKLAEAFYVDINDNVINEVSSETPLRGRPSLNDEVGQPPNEHLQPGWLFEKAMQYSNGNPNLALSLISVCGHDDTARGNLIYELSSSSDSLLIEQLNNYLQAIDYDIEETRQYYVNSMKNIFKIKDIENISEEEKKLITNNQYVNSLQQKLNRLTAFRAEVARGNIQLESPAQSPREIDCPRDNSAFYLSKSLGLNVDISDDEKTRIATIQAPTMGRAAIPSKNYHLMGAAYMACSLVNEGVSPSLAILIQKMAGWSYRTIRMSNMINKNLDKAQKIQASYQKYVDEFNGANPPRSLRARRARNRGEVNPEVEQPTRLSIEEWILTLIHRKEEETSKNYIIYYLDLDHNSTREDVDRQLAMYDASLVFDEMTVGGGSILGVAIPQTNLSINFASDPIGVKVNLAEGQSETTAPRTNNRRRGRRGNSLGWPEDRYQRARDKALTYLIDWEWTTQQHEAGARFAAENCSRQDPDHQLDDDACQAFNLSPGETCNIDYEGQVAKDTFEYQADESEDSSNTPVTNLADSLGAVAQSMEEIYLAPDLNVVETSEGNLEINGVY